MKTQQTIGFIFLAVLFAITMGCTRQAWYEGAKMGAENNCRRQPASEAERCLENLNKKTYEEYEKERSGQQ